MVHDLTQLKYAYIYYREIPFQLSGISSPVNTKKPIISPQCNHTRHPQCPNRAIREESYLIYKSHFLLLAFNFISFSAIYQKAFRISYCTMPYKCHLTLKLLIALQMVFIYKHGLCLETMSGRHWIPPLPRSSVLIFNLPFGKI